jgi:uncharacterized membrane protein
MEMKDVTQGRLLLVLSFVTMFVYFWAIFLAPQDAEFLGRTVSDWALIIPVMLIVYLFLVVVAWIGWAMATTPPPIPTSGKELEGKEEIEKEKKGSIYSFRH